jgi:hypothetical protein
MRGVITDIVHELGYLCAVPDVISFMAAFSFFNNYLIQEQYQIYYTITG